MGRPSYQTISSTHSKLPNMIFPPEKADGSYGTESKAERDQQDEVPPPYLPPTDVGSSSRLGARPPQAGSYGAGGSYGASSDSVLNSQPPSFSRAPSSTVPYTPFPSCALLSVTNELSSGFPPMPPPALVQPHPFASHDIKEEDWTRFLDDCRRGGALVKTPNRFVAGIAPVAARRHGLISTLVSSALQGSMGRSNRTNPVLDIVEQWNHYFFHPRSIGIALVEPSGSGSGMGMGSRDDGYSSSSSSDSDRRHGRRSGRRSSKRDRRADKRAARQQGWSGLLGNSSGGGNGADSKWQLVVSFRPAVGRASYAGAQSAYDPMGTQYGAAGGQYAGQYGGAEGQHNTAGQQYSPPPGPPPFGPSGGQYGGGQFGAGGGQYGGGQYGSAEGQYAGEPYGLGNGQYNSAGGNRIGPSAQYGRSSAQSPYM